MLSPVVRGVAGGAQHASKSSDAKNAAAWCGIALTETPQEKISRAGAQRPRAKLPGGSGQLSLLYARPAGDSSTPGGPARRVSFSELLGGAHMAIREGLPSGRLGQRF